MGQDPAGRAVLIGGVALLAAWLAIATATAWLLFRRTDHPTSSAWLWAGGAATLVGGVVLAVLIVQTALSFSTKRQQDYHNYLSGLRADEQRRNERTDPE